MIGHKNVCLPKQGLYVCYSEMAEILKSASKDVPPQLVQQKQTYKSMILVLGQVNWKCFLSILIKSK